VVLNFPADLESNINFVSKDHCINHPIDNIISGQGRPSALLCFITIQTYAMQHGFVCKFFSGDSPFAVLLLASKECPDFDMTKSIMISVW
jgi:hypothetical protein